MACSTDAAAIARVHVDSWRTTYRGLVSEDFLAALSYERREHMWHDILAPSHGSTFVYVAEDPWGQVVGFASGGPERSGHPLYTGELYAIYILQDHQRRGIGRRLLVAIVRRLIQAGMASLLVWVLSDNPARRFYETLGGQYVFDKQVSIGDAQLVEVAYGWRDAGVLVTERSFGSEGHGP
jgi:GNAT superfamily N-acetyltransferase